MTMEMIEETLNDNSDVYVRICISKKDALDEIGYINDGKAWYSENVETGEEEDGLSVADEYTYLNYITTQTQYIYFLTGEYVGRGSDEEPLLNPNTVKVVSEPIKIERGE